MQNDDHDLPRLRLLASRNSPSLSLLSFAPTLGLFVVQSRNSRDPWESTWESDSMGPIVFSTGKCRDASTCTYTVDVSVHVYLRTQQIEFPIRLKYHVKIVTQFHRHKSKRERES